MFWVGAAAGAFVMMIVGCASVGIMARSITKEREADGNKYKVEAEKLYQQWRESNQLVTKQNDILSDILTVIDK